MELFIGLDLSSNCIGATFLYGGKVEFVTLLNRWEMTVAKEYSEERLVRENSLLRDLKQVRGLDVVLYDREPNAVPKRKKTKDKDNFIRDLTRWESNHMRQCEELSVLLAGVLLRKVQAIEKANKISASYCLIESLAVGKKDTDNLIQVCEFSYPIKQIMRKMVGADHVFRISSSEVKQFAFGNGNALKVDMLDAFISKGDNTELLKFVKSNRQRIVKELKKVEIVKPIEDIVDSYWIAKFLESNLRKFI